MSKQDDPNAAATGPMQAYAALVQRHFGTLTDRRQLRKRKYPLVSLLAIALLASLSGFEGFDQFEAFAAKRYDWLREFLDLPDGDGPSDDTFRRVFLALPPRVFAAAVFAWLQALAGAVTGKTIAIDGKSLRRTFDVAAGQSPLHIVHAWVVEHGVLIGQEATDAKSNEIPAVTALLARLEVAGAVVTMDAMGCQKSHTQQIIAGDGDYLLTVKDNQPTLHAAIQAAFAADAPAATTHADETLDFGHGRAEHRAVTVQPVPRALQRKGEWAGLRSIVRVERTRVVGDAESFECAYAITSLPAARVLRIADALRGHWGVENALHWSLDMTFREDESRVRQRSAAENLALVRRLALSLLKNDTIEKTSIRIKRLLAAMDPLYALRVLLTAVPAQLKPKS